ncbi:acetyl esterase [Gordonibacter massiliensis (ex Traore et al. 2017)]|uniref:Acetyl esterase n=1 Tax=Gordonibacter massiliensis (ex Traore et al. 2017) TaxID=1841863 RepID=A0A842JAL9_9ACTN|nr:acetyl esterase [Gordonibacter massiliensis (ex Traore et al. 2017)]MBC2889202.1 acetyl esterase [Gordonibacter massiliensis (ex Traore et al. 2017)]
MNKLDVLAKINPQMKAVLAREDELAGDANDTSAGFEQMRENYVAGRAYWAEGGPVMAETLDASVRGLHGDIPVRYYYPTREAAAGRAAGEPATPGIVYAHGGGFVLGNLDTHDRICRILADKTGAVVVAVDYRLSPEAKYPSAVEEVAAVAEHLHVHGAAYGIDGDRLAFAGDSGGAHLGLAATLYLREERGGSGFVKCLLLFYGWFGLTDSSSMRLLGGAWDGLTEEDWQWYLGLYAEDPAELARARYANLFLNDLTRDVPACYVAAAEFDPLRDDSTTLAAILEQYGTPVRYEVFEGVIHAFLHYTKMLDEANDALEHAATFYRQQLGL